MYLNTMSDVLKGKTVYSVQECLLKMVKEGRGSYTYFSCKRIFVTRDLSIHEAEFSITKRAFGQALK